MKKRDFNIIIVQFIKQDYNWLLKYFPHIYLLTNNSIRWNPFVFPENVDIEPESWLTDMTEVFCSINYFRATSKPMILDAVMNCDENNMKKITFAAIENEIKKTESAKKGSRTSDVYHAINARFKSFIRSPALNSENIFPVGFWRKNDIILDLKGMETFSATTFVVCLIQALTLCNVTDNVRNKLSTLFVCDESYMLFKRTRAYEEMSTQEPLENLLRTMREPGIGLVSGAQNKNSVSPVLIENSSHFFTFRTPPECKKDTQQLFGLNNDQADYLMQLPKKAVGVARVANYPEPFIFRVPEHV